MASWKRDFASGLIVVVPILVTAYVIAWLYGLVASVTPKSVIDEQLLTELGVNPVYAEVIRVFVSLSVFVVLVFAIGYLMRTAIGGVFEGLIDDFANRVPILRVVYNASKMAAETALGGAESLQAPVKLEVWDGLRMTAFKTGKTTTDGREVLFLPTAPNVTTGFVIEVEPERFTETDERVEDALTRILSAGFGDADAMGGTQMPMSALLGDGDEDESDGDEGYEGDGDGTRDAETTADGRAEAGDDGGRSDSRF